MNTPPVPPSRSPWANPSSGLPAGSSAVPAPSPALGPDLLLDRRKLKRSRGIWRALAVLLVAGGIGALALRDDAGSLPAGLPALGGPHLLRFTVSGAIAEDRRTVEALDRAARNASVRGLLLVVDSPGGTVAGGESLHAALTRFRDAGKPVIATFGGTAASAGYMIAMPAERVFAREGTVTGSIGVLLQSFEASEALARLGIRAETIASGVLKDQPSPFRPLTEEGRAALRAVISDLHTQFVAMVVRGRNLPEARVREIADGRVLTGRQALAAGLVDAIGGEPEARAHFASAHGIAREVPIRDLRTRDLSDRAFGAGLAEAFGEGLAAGLVAALKSVILEGVGVDGVRALWQPSAR